MKHSSSRSKSESDGGGVAYLVCGILGTVALMFGGVAAYLLLATTGPKDIIAIFLGFGWVFISVIVEMVVITRAGLFRQSSEPAVPMSDNEPGDVASVFYGKTYEVSASAEAKVKDPVLRSRLTAFMVISAVGLLAVEIVLWRAGRSTIGGFVFSLFFIAFMLHWARLSSNR